MSLLDRRLIVVTGKGGVGRSTTAAALGLLAARHGRRTVLLELYGEHAAAEILGLSGASYAARQPHPNLDVMNLTPIASVTDFAQRKLHVPRVAAKALDAAPMRTLLETVPGLQDVVQLGKIEDMLRAPLARDPHYDLAILDAPATGHGLTLLSSAQSMAEMTRVGPFFDLAENIADFLSQRDEVGFLTVTLPELLPVSEALQLVDALNADHTPPDLLVSNQVRDEALATTWDTLRPAVAARPHTDNLVALADEVHDDLLAQRAALHELAAGLASRGLDLPVASLPRRPTPPRGLDALAPLARALAPLVLGDTP